MERAVSFLGLLVLMGLAYAFSVHRKSVNFRTIAWGVGLQLTFAVIILSEGTRSFIGMCVLASLILLYVTHYDFEEKAGGLVRLGAIVLPLAAALVFASYHLAKMGVTIVLLMVALLTVAVTTKLIDSLSTKATPRNREQEAEKARRRWQAREAR